jgi:site-specific recombinase XerD
VHVKEAVGHSDLRTTMAYTHLAREHLRSLVDAPVTQALDRQEMPMPRADAAT